jgi:hypothetical protein
MIDLNEEEKQLIADCLWSVRYNKVKLLNKADTDVYFDVMQKLGFCKVMEN